MICKWVCGGFELLNWVVILVQDAAVFVLELYNNDKKNHNNNNR